MQVPGLGPPRLVSAYMLTGCSAFLLELHGRGYPPLWPARWTSREPRVARRAVAASHCASRMLGTGADGATQRSMPQIHIYII